jgi:hypothetical protein
MNRFGYYSSDGIYGLGMGMGSCIISKLEKDLRHFGASVCD